MLILPDAVKVCRRVVLSTNTSTLMTIGLTNDSTSNAVFDDVLMVGSRGNLTWACAKLEYKNNDLMRSLTGRAWNILDTFWVCKRVIVAHLSFAKVNGTDFGFKNVPALNTETVHKSFVITTKAAHNPRRTIRKKTFPCQDLCMP